MTLEVIEDRLESYRKWLKEVQGLDDSTIPSYISHARVCEIVKKKLGKDVIDREVIVKILESYDRSTTKNQLKVGLRRYLQYIGLRDLADEIKVSKVSRELEWWWSVDDVKKLFNSCENDLELILVSLGYLQAMRRKEIADVRVLDIDLANEVIRVRIAKKKGTYFMNKRLYRAVRGDEWYPDQVELIKRYIANNALSGNDRLMHHSPVYLNIIFKRIVKRAGVRPAGIHMLRHSRAAHLRSIGVPLDIISRFLCHENIGTTMLYAHIGPEELMSSIPPPA